MKIVVHLEFLKSSRKSSQAFKSSAAFELFDDYRTRIDRYMECEVAASLEQNAKILTPQDEIWICDRAERAKISSSEAIAERLQNSLVQTPKNLRVVIGGPDGFPDEFFKIHPKIFRWSFGPMTLPHELAAVVASEQLYRAFTIVRKEPYHLGHK